MKMIIQIQIIQKSLINIIDIKYIKEKYHYKINNNKNLINKENNSEVILNLQKIIEEKNDKIKK